MVYGRHIIVIQSFWKDWHAWNNFIDHLATGWVHVFFTQLHHRYQSCHSRFCEFWTKDLNWTSSLQRNQILISHWDLDTQMFRFSPGFSYNGLTQQWDSISKLGFVAESAYWMVQQKNEIKCLMSHLRIFRIDLENRLPLNSIGYTAIEFTAKPCYNL